MRLNPQNPVLHEGPGRRDVWLGAAVVQVIGLVLVVVKYPFSAEVAPR